MKTILSFIALTVFFCNAYAADGNEAFYGRWVIKGKITSGPVSAYSEAEAQSLVGKEIVFSANSVGFDHVNKSKPFYEQIILSENEFQEKYLISSRRLGIRNTPIIEIDVYVDSSRASLWDSVGNVFFIKNKNSLILFSGGVFFELSKQKK